MISSRSIFAASPVAALAALAAVCLAQPAVAAEEADDPWPDLRDELFQDRPIHDGAGVIGLEAPYRAHDAAIVPITIVAEIPQSAERHITSITLLVDKNPMPVAAVFQTSPKLGNATIATRIRVNEYTNVRAIAETSDGELYMAAKFVKAAGGCSAPALKDQEKAITRLGKMKFKQADGLKVGEINQAQVMISHPNYSGFQMNQLTRHYIPAHYVEAIEVQYGGETLMTVEGGISLSEDPNLRFRYVPEAPGNMTVIVRDSEQTTYTGSWSVPASPSS